MCQVSPRGGAVFGIKREVKAVQKAPDARRKGNPGPTRQNIREGLGFPAATPQMAF